MWQSKHATDPVAVLDAPAASSFAHATLVPTPRWLLSRSKCGDRALFSGGTTLYVVFEYWCVFTVLAALLAGPA